MSGNKCEENIRKVLATHDGDVALLYLFLYNNKYNEDDAALALCRTVKQIQDAYEKLSRLNLIHFKNLPEPSSASDRKDLSKRNISSGTIKKYPYPADACPSYKATDIEQRANEDKNFEGILAEAQRLLGHHLSEVDLQKLFSIYDYLSLPSEVIIELLSFCKERNIRKNGSGSSLSMRTIEREAYEWANQDIITFDKAESYIASYWETQSKLNEAANVLGIRGRTLSATEQKYIRKWLDMGFPIETLEIALDRTVTNTGKLAWKYMDKIISTWDAHSVYTPEQVNLFDSGKSNNNNENTSECSSEQYFNNNYLKNINDMIDNS